MNHKRKKARVNTYNRTDETFPNGSPSWWHIVYNVRPKRRRDNKLVKRVLDGEDFDGIPFELGNHKPHEYYW